MNGANFKCLTPIVCPTNPSIVVTKISRNNTIPFDGFEGSAFLTAFPQIIKNTHNTRTKTTELNTVGINNHVSLFISYEDIHQ